MTEIYFLTVLVAGNSEMKVCFVLQPQAYLVSGEPDFNVFNSVLFLGSHLQHLEVPRLGVGAELKLLAYATATATPDQSHICHLHRSSWQCWILNPLSEARDWTHVLMDASPGSSATEPQWEFLGVPFLILRFRAMEISDFNTLQTVFPIF